MENVSTIEQPTSQPCKDDRVEAARARVNEANAALQAAEEELRNIPKVKMAAEEKRNRALRQFHEALATLAAL